MIKKLGTFFHRYKTFFGPHEKALRLADAQHPSPTAGHFLH
jgi:hypothetical protein